MEVPFVTVIMPVRNEAAYIERSLGAVLAQDYPADRLEVLVVDGLSTDGTRDIVGRMAQPPRVRLLDNPAGIVPPGLNIGIRQARGEIVVVCDVQGRIGYASPAKGTSFSNEVIGFFSGDAGAVRQAIITAREVGVRLLGTLGSQPACLGVPYI